MTHTDGTVDFVAPGETSSQAEEHSRTTLHLTDLPGNSIHAGLSALDAKLTPHQGLRRLAEDGSLVPATERSGGRTLLVMHGTFSNSDNLLAGIGKGDPEFLRWAAGAYDRVLTFDYPSLSRRSIANAMTLQRTVRDRVDGDVDVLCHSQGGLITRYWLERLEPARLERSRVILVGAPLAGTSLAAPANLRRALRLLGIAATVLGVGATVVSGTTLLGAIGGLSGVVHKVVGLGAVGGLIDAAVALVPGVDSMSRVGTNFELNELRAGTTGVPPAYFAISGSYDPPKLQDKAPWKRASIKALDDLRSETFGDDNDLVVDTASQTELSDRHVIGRDDPGRVYRFERGDDVHHRSYFSQPAALEFMAQRLRRD